MGLAVIVAGLALAVVAFALGAVFGSAMQGHSTRRLEDMVIQIDNIALEHEKYDEPAAIKIREVTRPYWQHRLSR